MSHIIWIYTVLSDHLYRYLVLNGLTKALRQRRKNLDSLTKMHQMFVRYSAFLLIIFLLTKQNLA